MKTILLKKYVYMLLITTMPVYSSALAAEYVVSTPTTLTNGNAVVFNNFGSITNSGTISTAGIYSKGILTNNNNTIINSGSISTAGRYSEGIFVWEENTVTNTGNISTSGIGSDAIVGGNFNYIANSGTISTAQNYAEGIRARNNNTIINTGSISISGNWARAISARDNNIVRNDGTISTAGESSSGAIVVLNSNTITNTGQILVNGDNYIQTWGSNSSGISARSDNTIVNSGYISAPKASAFNLWGKNNTLNLLAPSFIAGQIDLGTTATVNITTGRSQSVLWSLNPESIITGNPTITGEVPGAWNQTTEQFATIDPTALSAASDVLADITSTLSELTRMNGAAENNEWWLQGYGKFSEFAAQGIFNDYTTINGGIAAGGSFVLNDNISIGAMIGYQANKLNVNSAWMPSQTIEGNGVVGSVSANATMGNLFADFTIFGGAQNNTSSRLINDNLAALGIDYAEANYNSWFIAPELRLGMDIEVNDAWTITPSATARYSMQQVGAYVETGSNANATFGARNAQVFEGNIELAVTRDMGIGFVTVRGGAQYRQNASDAVDVTLIGQYLSIPPNNTGSLTGYIGGDISLAIGDMTSMDLSANIAMGQNNFSASGSLGFKAQF